MEPATRFDGRTLAVHIPMRLGRTRGRKRILAPDGSELTPPRHPQPDTTLVKALARAWRWQRLLDRGVYASVSEIAEAERISKSYVSRVLRLALLAPDILEAILAGTTGPAVGFEQLETGVPASWEEQRRSILGPLRLVGTPNPDWNMPDGAMNRDVPQQAK